MRYLSTTTSPIETLYKSLGPRDLVFESTGSASVIPSAMRAVAPDGVCILGSVTTGSEEMPFDMAAWNRHLVLGNRVVFGTVNASRRHFEAGVRDLAAAQERFPGWAERLITRRLPVGDAAKAFEKTPGQIKSVLRFD